MSRELFEQLKAGSEAAVAALGPNDRVGLVAFSNRVQLLLPPSAEPSSMASAIAALEADGDTSLYDATFAAIALRGRSSRRMLLLVFSEGEDTASWLDPTDVLAAPQRSDLVTDAVVAEDATSSALRTARSSELLRNPMDLLRRMRDRQVLFDTHPRLFGSVYLPRLVEETGGSLFRVTATGPRDAFVRIVTEFKNR